MPTIELSVDRNTNIVTKALYYLFISAIYFTGIGIIAALGIGFVILGLYGLLIIGVDSNVDFSIGIILLGFLCFFVPYLYFYYKLKGMQDNLMGGRNIQLSDLENKISNLINDKQFQQAIDKINETLGMKITFRIKNHFKFVKGVLLLELNRLEDSRITWDDLDTDLLEREQLGVFFKYYPELKKNQIKILLEEQNPESALKIVDKAISKTTDSVNLLILKGIIQLELQKTNQAYKTLEKGLKKHDITQEEQETINNLLTQPYQPNPNWGTTPQPESKFSIENGLKDSSTNTIETNSPDITYASLSGETRHIRSKQASPTNKTNQANICRICKKTLIIDEEDQGYHSSCLFS